MDRFFRGLIAGMIGGIAMNIWSFIAYYILKLPIRRFLDWAGIILYGDYPHTVYEASFALLMQILWVGLLGIVFTYLIPQTTSRGYLIKGAFYGVMIGFIIFAIPTLLGTRHLETTNFTSVLSNHFGGLIWGLTLAQMLKLLDSSVEVKENRTKVRYAITPSSARKMIKKRNKK